MFTKKFIESHIRLDEPRIASLKKLYSRIKLDIERNLSVNFPFRIQIQGSVKTKTAVIPMSGYGEYDLDIAIVFSKHLTMNEHKSLRDLIWKILGESFDQKVSRNNKCLNLNINNEFNVDIVILSEFEDSSSHLHQEILYESENKIVMSDNLVLASKFNEVFKTRSDNGFRDLIFLIKYYARQFKTSNEKMPSVAWSALVWAESFSDAEKLNSLHYDDFLYEMISRIIVKIKSFNSFPLTLEVKDYEDSPRIKIHTNLSSDHDRDQVIRVLNFLSEGIKNDSVKKLAPESYFG